MKLRVVVSLLAVFLFLAMACGARAQDYSKFEAFGGYSYVRANPSGGALASFNLNGGEAALSYNANSWLSGVMDFGGYHTSREVTPPCTLVACPATAISAQGNMWTYMFGPRLSYRHLGRVTPYGQLLLGVAHTTPNVWLTESQTHFAMSIGGGVDYRLTSRVSLRPLQVDYLLTHFDEFGISSRPTQNNLRLSTGVVFHF